LSDQKTELIDHINRSGFTELQKPDTLTTSGRINCNYHKYFSNMHLIPAKDGQFTPAWGGQGHWLFQYKQEFYLIELDFGIMLF
jgi:hypothetical protein